MFVRHRCIAYGASVLTVSVQVWLTARFAFSARFPSHRWLGYADAVSVRKNYDHLARAECFRHLTGIRARLEAEVLHHPGIL